MAPDRDSVNYYVAVAVIAIGMIGGGDLAKVKQKPKNENRAAALDFLDGVGQLIDKHVATVKLAYDSELEALQEENDTLRGELNKVEAELARAVETRDRKIATLSNALAHHEDKQRRALATLSAPTENKHPSLD